GVPHFEALFVAEQEPAFPKIFVIRIDPAAHVRIRIDPRACLDVDAGADKTNRRTALVGLHQGAFRLFVENRFTGELAESAELEKERTGFRRIRYRVTHLAGAEVNIYVRKPGWGIESGQQPITEVFGESEQPLIPGELIAREQTAK